MPFVKRKVDPLNIRKHQKASNDIFEEHSDVVNNALVNALMQLSSLTYHASDIFREIENEANFFFRRINQAGSKILNLQESCMKLNHKAVQIPVSDLDTEFKIPPHLHFRSGDSLEEDLFTTDSRDPCLIHLHHLARSDFSDVFRGSQAYAKPSKPARPKSFDPNIFLEEKTSQDLVLPSKSIANIASTVETEVDAPKSLLPTPDKRMQLESSQHKAEIISVDTSGSQFDRRVTLRRSQRTSVANTKRKNQKLKERHKTLTALPDHVSSDFDSSLSARENHFQENRPDLLPSSPVRRRLKNRHSMPATKSMPGSPQRGARVSLHHPVASNLSTFPRNPNNEKVEVNNTMTNGRLSSSEAESHQQQIFMNDKNAMAEDRISSGFWSGTESCRHSTTSEILMQHQNVTQALQQVLSNKPHPNSDENRYQIMDNETNASTLSINSRLSILDPASTLSSSMSLSHTPPGEQFSTPDDSYRIPRSEAPTPRQLNFATPAGAYNFMNTNFEPQPPQLPHLASPMDLLILGTRRGNDGIIRDEMESFDSSSYSQTTPTNQKYQVPYKAPFQDPLPVLSPKTPISNLESFDSSYTPDISNTSNAAGFKVTPQQEQRHPVFSPHLGVLSPNNFQQVTPRKESNSQDNRSVFTPSTPQTSFPRQHTSVLSASSNHAPEASITQSRFFGPSFAARNNSASSSASQRPSSAIDFQTELAARIEKQKRNSESNSKPSLPRRQSSLRSRHKEVKEILAYMEPLSNVETSQSTTNEKFSTLSPHIMEENFRNSTSQAPALPNYCDSADSSPQNNSSSSYQPSKTVAAQLQSRRPTTMYDFPLASHSPNDTPKRPISIVEPFAKSAIPAPNTFQGSLKSDKLPLKQGKKPVPLPVAPPSGRQVGVYQASCTSLTITPKTPLGPKLLTPSDSYPPSSITHLKASPNFSPTQTPGNTPKVQETPRKVDKTELNGFEPPPSVFPFSPAQLQAAGNSLRKTTSKDEETDPETPPKPLPTSILVSKTHSLTPTNKVGTPKLPQSTATTPTFSSPTTSKVQNSVAVSHTSKSATFVDTVSKQTAANLPDNGVQTKPSPAKKPPVAAKPSSFTSKKPAVRPKPLLSPRPNSQVGNKATTNNDGENKQQALKNSDLKTKNATMRAAFFALSPSLNENLTEKNQKPTEPKKEKVNTDSTVKHQVEEKESPAEARVNPSPMNSIGGYLETSVPAVNNQTVKQESITIRSSENIASLITETNKEINGKTDDLESIPFSSSDSVALETDIDTETDNQLTPPTHSRICNGVDHGDQGMDIAGDNLTADDFNSSITPVKSDFKTSMQRLRGSYYSPSTPTDYSPGNKSPSNTLGFDRRSNFRFSTSSLERRRKTTSNTALREDFKALLLQNLPKSNSGSQMSATEKLKMAKQSPMKLNHSTNGEDVADCKTPGSAQSRLLPQSDIRSGMGASRSGRKMNRMPEHRKSYAATTGFTTKKHPPISSSGRFHTRSRTPTRPMMAITEDSETENSPEKPLEELLQRSQSVGEF